MKVLYICRVFTGLETSLLAGKWAPTGVPTIYKVMEALARPPHDSRFLLATRGIGRDYATAWNASQDKCVELEGFPKSLHVLAGESRFPVWLGRLRGILTSLRHLFWICWHFRTFAPDIVYVDRAHALIGAILARFFGARVVLRVMGVYPSMWDMLAGRSVAAQLERWAFKAPFAMALCTQDGSGGEFWMDKALARATPRRMMLNGVEFLPPAPTRASLPIPEGRTVVLFIGRLEWNKGCEPFVEALLSLPDDYAARIHGVIIGTGSQRDKLLRRIEATGAQERFTFIDRLPHAQIRDAHRQADIYVSLNRLGQLSNANLEVISGGNCFVALDAQLDRKIDVGTWNLIPPGAAVRIPIEREVPALAQAIMELSDAPERRREMAEQIRAAAAGFIPSWSDRIAAELSLLETIATGGKVPTTTP